MLIRKFLWTVPFVCFITGYQLLNFIFITDHLPTPHLIGLQLDQAVKITAAKNLNLRIITEKPDYDLPNHTIISQTPTSKTVRSNQTIHIVISQRPTTKIAPKLIGLTNQEIHQIASDQNLQIKIYQISSSQPKDICLAQSPEPEQVLTNSKLTAYLSCGPTNLITMPKFINHNQTEVINFLKEYSVNPQIITACNPNLPDQTVLDQRPVPAAILDISKLKQIQICVNDIK